MTSQIVVCGFDAEGSLAAVVGMQLRGPAQHRLTLIRRTCVDLLGRGYMPSVIAQPGRRIVATRRLYVTTQARNVITTR